MPDSFSEPWSTGSLYNGYGIALRFLYSVSHSNMLFHWLVSSFVTVTVERGSGCCLNQCCLNQMLSESVLSESSVV